MDAVLAARSKPVTQPQGRHVPSAMAAHAMTATAPTARPAMNARMIANVMFFAFGGVVTRRSHVAPGSSLAAACAHETFWKRLLPLIRKFHAFGACVRSLRLMLPIASRRVMSAM